MTKERSFDLAYQAALQNWVTAKEKAEAHNGNQLLELRVKKAWDEVNEVRDMSLETK